MSMNFTRPAIIATTALSLMVGAAFAQDATTATVQPVAATDSAAVALPTPLDGLGLTDVTTKDGRRGSMIRGTLPEGGEINAILDRDGALRMIHAGKDNALPQAVIDALLPQGARASEQFGQLAVVNGIGQRDGHVMVLGADADGEKLHMGFDTNGELLAFGKGERMGKGPGEHGKKRGEDARGGHHRGDHGPRGWGDRGENCQKG